MDVFLLENKKNCKNFEIPLLHFTNLKLKIKKKIQNYFFK